MTTEYLMREPTHTQLWRDYVKYLGLGDTWLNKYRKWHRFVDYIKGHVNGCNKVTGTMAEGYVLHFEKEEYLTLFLLQHRSVDTF